MLDWLKTILGDGYTEEIENKVSAEIGKGFVAKADYNTVNTELKTARTTITERDGQLETLKKSTGDVEALKAQITTLQTDNVQKDKDHAAEIAKIKKDAIVDQALAEVKAKNNTAAKALMAEFLEKAELTEDGKEVKGLTDELKKITADEKTAFLFDTQAATPPGISGAQPAGNPTAPPDPKLQGYQTRLTEARKNNDTVAAVQIKQEAAANGVSLL